MSKQGKRVLLDKGTDCREDSEEKAVLERLGKKSPKSKSRQSLRTFQRRQKETELGTYKQKDTKKTPQKAQRIHNHYR